MLSPLRTGQQSLSAFVCRAGEHGTGRNVAPFVEMEWGSKAYELMWDLKQLFDPDFVLNPGVLLNRCALHSFERFSCCAMCNVQCGLDLHPSSRCVYLAVDQMKVCEHLRHMKLVCHVVASAA